MWRVWAGGEVCTGLWWGNLRKKDHGGDPDVDRRIILRWMFRKWEGVVGTGWSWLGIGRGGGHLWVRQWTFGSQNAGNFLTSCRSAKPGAASCQLRLGNFFFLIFAFPLVLLIRTVILTTSPYINGKKCSWWPSVVEIPYSTSFPECRCCKSKTGNFKSISLGQHGSSVRMWKPARLSKHSACN